MAIIATGSKTIIDLSDGGYLLCPDQHRREREERLDQRRAGVQVYRRRSGFSRSDHPDG